MERNKTLKKILILIVISLVAWQFFLKDNTTSESSKSPTASDFSNSNAMKTLEKAKALAEPKSVYTCDGREHCSQMTSFEEAKYFIEHCPNTKMDGDNDGIPCERQFGQ